MLTITSSEEFKCASHESSGSTDQGQVPPKAVQLGLFIFFCLVLHENTVYIGLELQNYINLCNRMGNRLSKSYE